MCISEVNSYLHMVSSHNEVYCIHLLLCMGQQPLSANENVINWHAALLRTHAGSFVFTLLWSCKPLVYNKQMLIALRGEPDHN